MGYIKSFIYMFFLTIVLTAGSFLGLKVSEKAIEKYDDWKESRKERKRFE